MTTPRILPEVEHTIPDEFRGLCPLMPAVAELTFRQFVENHAEEMYRSLGLPAHLVTASREIVSRELSRIVK